MTLLVHAVSSFMMIGLIWTVQVVHYPLFLSVGPGEWARYHARHVRNIGFIVGPLMVAELLTGALLAFRAEPAWAVWTNLALVLLVWGATAFVQMPLHGKLAQRHDAAAIRRLVRTNWVRTITWSLHGTLVVALLALSH